MVDIKARDHPIESTLSGYVYSTNRAILNGAKVTCDEFERMTLADGFYTFNELPPGTFKVTVTLKGYQAVSKVVTIKDNESVLQDFYLNKASGVSSIKGNIRDSETSELIRNKGTVILILPISNRYAQIDEHGFYKFENLSAGTYMLSTSIPEYDDCNIVLTIKDGDSILYDFSCTKNRDVEPAWG